MKYVLLGTAVAALAACPLLAQGKGHGGGNAGGHGNAEHGPAKAPAASGPPMQRPSMQAAPHGNSGHASRSQAPTMQAAAPKHGNAHAKADRGHARPSSDRDNPGPPAAVAHAAKAHGPQEKEDRALGAKSPSAATDGDRNVPVRTLKDGRHYYTQRETPPRFDFAVARRGPIDGCPPGLARKNNGCSPPGLARQRSYRPDWWGVSALAGAPYYYNDGYLLRLNGERVASYLPLLGGALSVGNIWPSSYAPLPVPQYYVDYYNLGPAGSYRYADNVLYRVDPSTSAITAIAALLTGDTFQIGSPMPPGYDIYNVPYRYRDEYIDGPDARYRYSDGYIYQVDPKTQLITAAIDLLAGR